MCVGCSFQTGQAGPSLVFTVLHHSLHSVFGLCQGDMSRHFFRLFNFNESVDAVINPWSAGVLIATHSILTFQLRSGMGHLGSLGVISRAVHAM